MCTDICGVVYVSRRYNHGNVLVQELSIRMLAEDEYPFTWILPAHGRFARFRSADEKKRSLVEAATAFAAEDDKFGMFSVGYY